MLKLQAGFRPYYGRDIYANEKSFLECLLEAIDSHVSGICLELGIMRVDLKDWENALFQEIQRLLELPKTTKQHDLQQATLISWQLGKPLNVRSDT